MRRVVVLFVVLFAVLGTAVMFAALAMRGPARSAPEETVLLFNVPYRLEEGQAPAGGLFEFARRERPTVWTVAQGIRHAASDPHVVAMVLHVDGIGWGWGKVHEIRDAVAAFRSAGKPVYATVSGGGELEYLLASVADTIAAPPLAVLQLNGLTVSALFMRGALDKLGVTPNFAHAGRYKSGVEGWTRTGMSPPTREALEGLVDDAFALLTDSLATARGVTSDSVARLLDDGPYTSREALVCGLVDTVMHAAEMDSLATAGGRRPTLTLTRYLKRIPRPHTGAHVALITAVGVIAEGRSRGDTFDEDVLGAETIIKALQDAREREAIRAVVLRIDSPGGSAQAADQIWSEVKRCAESKPVIVSMSDLAASGGYYIAAPADSIVAAPGTLTGSIGAYGGKLNLMGLYHKLGLNVETVARGRNAQMFSPYRDFSPEEAARFQGEMDEVYRVFLSRVAEGRQISVADVDSVAQGRVWTGLAAFDRGLVDALGGIDRAMDMARARADIADDETVIVETYPRYERTFLQNLFGELVGEREDEDEMAARIALPPVVRAWLVAAKFPTGAAIAMMPWSIEIR